MDSGLATVMDGHSERRPRYVHAAATVQSTPDPIRPRSRWALIIAATAVSTCALEVVATAAGAMLAASRILNGASQPVVFGFLAATYVLWFVGLRASVIANWRLLEQIGMNTNLLSKSMFELARRRSSSQRVQRSASAVGYVATEIAKEAPYYAGAFGTALLTDAVSSTDALIFLAGTNVGAAVYEYGVAQLSCAFLSRRTRRGVGAIPWATRGCPRRGRGARGRATGKRR